MQKLKYILSWILWPFFFITCLTITAYGFSAGHPYLYFNLAYMFLILSLLFFEWFMPHEKAWRASDEQNWANIFHTVTSKGTVQALLYVNTLIGVTDLTNGMDFGLNLWPNHLPMIVQVSIAIVASESMLYWAHRTAHVYPFLWRFHAIHHSVTKLWIVNTGRFHFMDSLYKIVLGLIPLLILGAPMVVLTWVAAVTAFIGMMTHCNVEMRFGPLSWIFNTPELHRWHHSKDLREGDKNFGENIVLWDIVWRTYFREDRRPPVDIGIKEPMPKKFRYQIIWPFLPKKKQAHIISKLQESELINAHRHVAAE